MPSMKSLKHFLTLAFVLFFGGIFLSGFGLTLTGVASAVAVLVGVAMVVAAPVTALVGAKLDESPRSTVGSR